MRTLSARMYNIQYVRKRGVGLEFTINHHHSRLSKALQHLPKHQKPPWFRNGGETSPEANGPPSTNNTVKQVRAAVGRSGRSEGASVFTALAVVVPLFRLD